MTPFARRRHPQPQQQCQRTCFDFSSLLQRITVTLISLLILQFTVVSADDSSNCAMDIWIFSSFESCQASDAPVANGKIYADGQCHTIETDLDTSNPSYSSFPGNYRVQCVDTNKIRFSDSACLDNTCAITTSGAAVCDRDNASPASLYSRLEPPEYLVQDPSNANIGAFYTCLKLDGSEQTVTFVVFGDCSQSGCVIAPPAPTTAAPIVPPPSSITTEPPTTAPPIATSVAPVTAVPITSSIAPIWNITTTAPVPTQNISNAPTLAPIRTTIAPVPLATLTPTTISPTVSKPTATAPTAPVPTKGLVHDLISVAIRLSPMNTTIDTTSDSIGRWEDVTIDQIRTVAESDVYGTIVYAIDIANITQEVIDLTASANNDNEDSSSSNTRRRSLQEDGDVAVQNATTISTGTTKAMALQIMYVISMSYTPSTTLPMTLADLFTASFDSEQERSNYLIKLVTNDDVFTSVRLVEVMYVNGTKSSTKSNPPTGTPVAAPTDEATSKSGEKSSTGLLVALAGGGTALILFAIIGIVFYQRQGNSKTSSNNSKENITKEGETPSDNDEYYGGDGPVGPLNFSNNQHPRDHNSPSQQRWTNEIVVDPSADDVSTLGGSVLVGYLDPTTTNPNNNNNDTSHVEDEPTASVNLDFDYNNNQYRSDVEDRSRTVNTEATGPTTFTNFTSKLGMNGEAMFSDDASFDELYAEMDDAPDNDKTNHPIAKNPSHLNKIANMVKPFEVRAPPGKLGMVVDTPNGGVPVVRAIRPDSVLHGSVLVGDRLISVDNKDVTNMTALEVSSLISLKQHQHRLLVFCRIQQPTLIATTAATPQGITFTQPSPVGTAMATTSY